MIKAFLGASKRYLLNLLNTPAIVLLYHRVTHLPSDPQALAVSPENFYDHVSLLKKGFNLLSIEEFSELLLSRKKIPRNSVIITFDDGYSDNYYEALPILESFNSQALFYITTSNLDTGFELWWDELERIILENRFLSEFVEIKINGRLMRFPVSNPTEKTNTYNSLHRYLKYNTPEQRDRILSTLRQSIGLNCVGRKSHRLLTNEELRLLSQSRAVVIGAHTHNHPALSVLPYDIQLSEIETSKNILEKNISKEITHFSYPYGSKKDYNGDTLKACREVGFKLVCSNYYGHVHRWTDLMQLPRILVRDWDKKYFKDFILKSFKY
jgi:peptidoglycan/xylan/chitin deacetylase (PgdA/CDA1 family)